LSFFFSLLKVFSVFITQQRDAGLYTNIFSQTILPPLQIIGKKASTGNCYCLFNGIRYSLTRWRTIWKYIAYL